jgi:hypothetical protein
MLLADGHVVYYGGAAAVLSWFSALGFECPFGVNVADFLLDLAQGEVAGGGGKAAANGGGKGKQQPKDDRKKGGAAAAANGGGDGELTGPAAIQALWASYEEFARTHKQGFTKPEQLKDLTLQLEPPAATAPAGKSGGASAAAAAVGHSAVQLAERASVKAGLEEGQAVNGESGRQLSSVTPRSSFRASSMRVISNIMKHGRLGDGGSDDDSEDEGMPGREITRVSGPAPFFLQCVRYSGILGFEVWNEG